jgi:hypothetical protein
LQRFYAAMLAQRGNLATLALLNWERHDGEIIDSSHYVPLYVDRFEIPIYSQFERGADNGRFQST